MAPFPVRVIRGIARVGEHVAPRLTGQLAFRLFCRTPNPTSLSDGERRAVGQAAEFMSGARSHRLAIRSGSVVAHEFLPGQGLGQPDAVLVVHGWRSRTEYMKALIQGFVRAGYRVISLDLPGHGQSPGRYLNLALALDAVRAADERFGPFSAVVGHSFGGAVAANAVVGSVRGILPLRASRLVLIASPASMPDLFEDFGRTINLGPRSRMSLAKEIDRITGHPLSEFVGDRQLSRTSVPTLVIHAAEDREVPADHARLFAKAGEHVRLHWADGLGHRRILSNPGVVAETVGFVTGQRQMQPIH